MKSFVDKQYIKDLIELAIDTKTPYKLTRTSTLLNLAMDGTEYLCSINNSLPVKQLYFIAKVKRHIIENKSYRIKPNYTRTDKIRYIGINKGIKTGTVLKDCAYIDINNAYWRAAYLNGYIDRGIYEEGLKVHKGIRLASLGTFAKEPIVFTFNGKKEDMKIIKPEYPHIFYSQASTINDLIMKCEEAVKGSHILSWVDCIMTKDGESMAKCEVIVTDSGFELKKKHIGTVFRKKTGFCVDGKDFFIN